MEDILRPGPIPTGNIEVFGGFCKIPYAEIYILMCISISLLALYMLL
jgi:hypothetical protein